MARNRSVIVAGLNVRVHPHPEGIYQNLITAAYRLQRAIQIYGNDALLMTNLSLENLEKDGAVIGEIAKFTDIDFTQPWFSLTKNAQAEENELKAIIIPPHLKPNFKSFSFIFDIKNHILVFENYEI